MNVICKKCFLGVQAEQYSQMIEKCKAAISTREKVSDEVFADRIALCEECEYFTAATCRACGCYVELRAIKKSIHCPYKKW